MMHGPARYAETPSTSRARRWRRWLQCPATGLRLSELGRAGNSETKVSLTNLMDTVEDS